jgi:hypothetical protein
MTEALAERCVRAVHVITLDGQVLSAGRATLYVLDQVGWRRLAGAFSRWPLVWLVEVGYWLVARHRGVFSRILFRGK